MRSLSLPLAILLLASAAACGDDEGGDATDTPDAGGDPDATVGFDVPEREWTWFPVEGNTCMNGSATGIGLNLDFASDKLVVFLEGGGACFNPESCGGVAHQDGFGAAELADFAAYAEASGILKRDEPGNPVADWSYVFIPYCTGDVHAGAQPNGAGDRDYVGFGNVTRAVTLVEERLGASLSRVLLTGQSAGGFGAAFNYDQVATIFGAIDIPVDLLDDSGPPMSNTYLTPCFQEMVRERWNLTATIPSDCDECVDEEGGGLIHLVDAMSEKYPERRIGIVSSLGDNTIRQFYGFGYPNCDAPEWPMAEDVFRAGIEELRDEILPPLDNARIFTITGSHHVFTDDPLSETAVDSVTLGAWITAMLDGSADWDSVTPPPE